MMSKHVDYRQAVYTEGLLISTKNYRGSIVMAKLFGPAIMWNYC